MGLAVKAIPLDKHSLSGKLARRPINAELRSREYLTEAELQSLQKAAASQGHHDHRDATLILLTYRHALAAGLPFPVHPYMLRHACGLMTVRIHGPCSITGLPNIQLTVRYTELNARRSQGFWQG